MRRAHDPVAPRRDIGSHSRKITRRAIAYAHQAIAVNLMGNDQRTRLGSQSRSEARAVLFDRRRIVGNMGSQVEGGVRSGTYAAHAAGKSNAHTDGAVQSVIGERIDAMRAPKARIERWRRQIR